MKKAKIYLIISLILLLLTCTSFANNEIQVNNVVEDELISTIEESNEKQITNTTSKSNSEMLEEGIYKIYSSLASNRLIEAPNNSRSAKTYFKLGQNSNTANQKFQIIKNSDNTYTIKLLTSLNALDVQDGKAANKRKVWQYKSNGTDAQKWYIEKNSDNTYTFKSKLNTNYVLDVDNANTNVGTSIQIYKSNGTASQKFKLEECSKEKGSKTIENGTYKIVSSASTKKAITMNNSELKLNDLLNDNSQKYEIQYQSNGYYKIINAKSNKILTAGKDNTGKIYESNDENLDTQLWIIKKQKNGYSFVSKYLNLYMDLTNGSTANGTKIQLYRENDTDAQQFKLINMNQIVENGIYKIYSILTNNRLIESPNNSRTTKTYFKLGENANTASQKFEIKFNESDGTYSIKVWNSLNALDVQDGKVENRRKVWQYKSNGTDAQKWYINKNSDGTYTFSSKLDSNYVLDVDNANTNVGTSIQVYKSNGTASQKFKLEECSKEKGTQTVEDGTYRIISNANRKKAVTLKNGNLEINDDSLLDTQKYKINYQGNGYYKIIIPNTNKILTVNANDTTKIYEANDENLDTQLWIIKKQGEYYNLISKSSNSYVDLPNASTNNGTKLQLYRENDTNAQQFILVNLTPSEDIDNNFKEGIYQIVLTNNRVIDVSSGSYNNSANVQTWENDQVQQQKFRVSKIEGTNYYQINAIHSAKALDVANGDCQIGTNVQQYTINNTSSQQWYLKKLENGYYSIISVRNGLYLDISGGVANKNGQNVQIYYGNGTNSQKFKFTPIDIVKENTYEIETKLDSDMVLDVSSASKADGGNVQIWEADNVNQQRFIFTSITNEEYSIKAKHSGKVLTMQSNGNVVQSTDTKANNQRWYIKEVGNGYYNLVSKENGKLLDVADAKKTNGTNVQTYVKNGSNAQAFKFVTGFRKFFEEGTYGQSGLVKKGDKRGTDLKYYKYGKGDKVYFATFSIHGFEDSYAHDGEELTYIANEFKKYLDSNITERLVNEWTIYIFPNLNPDGQKYGTTNNGPGRTTLYSSAPKHKGIDMNRNWSTGYTKYSDNRNYNGTAAFQAYEAKALRDFLLDHQGKENVLVDLHGWLNETIGDNEIGKYYRNQFGMSKHISTYGRGYLVNWARSNLKNGRSSLVELPEVTKHSQVVSKKYSTKYINATIKMLNNI